MKILLQKNIWHEYGYDRFVTSLESAGAEVDIVHMIPFTNVFNKEINYKPDHCFGSTRFIHLCREREYKVFPSFEPIEPFYPSHLWINGDGGVTAKWGEIKSSITQPVFIKPYREKFFTGRVILDSDDLEKVQLSTSFIVDEDDEWVRISPARKITEEIRFFVLRGQIISASGYKQKGQGKHWRIDRIHPAWGAAKRILDAYGHIAEGFVLDMGLVDDEWMIVELNNLNSSGVYEIDTDALARALIYM